MTEGRESVCAGGIAVTLVGHPFDTLKVRLQSQSHTNPIYSAHPPSPTYQP